MYGFIVLLFCFFFVVFVIVVYTKLWLLYCMVLAMVTLEVDFQSIKFS